jgi:hypothetical protein
MQTLSSERSVPAPPHRRIALRLAILYFLVCLAYAGWSAVKDYRTDVKHVDFECWYVEGHCFLNGESPYNVDSYQARWAKVVETGMYGGRGHNVFIYPPTQALLMVPLAFLKSYPASRVFNALSFLSLLIILYMTGRFLVLSRVCRWETPLLWVGMGTACSLNSGVPMVLFVGQPTALAMAGTMGVVYYWHRKRTVLAALCVIVSTFKVPIGTYSLVNLFCRGAFAPVVLGAVLCAVVSFGFVALTPLNAFVPDMSESLKLYAIHPMTKQPNVTGIVSLLYPTFLRLPTMGWVLVGMVLSGLAGWLNRNEPLFPPDNDAGELAPTPTERLGNLVRYDDWYVPFLITGLFVQLKHYDAIIYTPIIVGAIAAGSWRGLWYAPGLILIGRIGTLYMLAQWFIGPDWFKTTAQAYGLRPETFGKWVRSFAASSGIAWVLLTHVVQKWTTSAPTKAI